MNAFNPSKMCFALFLVCAAMAVSSPAQTFSVITTFHGPNGGFPAGALVQGLDGNFYGVTIQGGNLSCQGGCGTIFKITPDGTLTTLHEFVGTDGFWPEGGLVLAADGNFYGTTAGGHPSGPPGAIFSFFKLTPGGTFSVVSSLPGTVITTALIQDTSNGTFYGTASGQNTAFSLTSSGVLKVLYSFCPNNNCVNVDGFNPEAPLLQDIGNGLLYGTAVDGGEASKSSDVTCSLNCGTVFVMGTGGTIKALYRFSGSDGANPEAGLTQADDGNFYGTTSIGGNGDKGTVFKITPAGVLATLYTFCLASSSCADGRNPAGALIQATDGNFYGTTVGGGTGSSKICNGCGTVFQLTPGGTLTTLHSFQAADGGVDPISQMVQGTDGNLYGMVNGGSPSYIRGALYKISTGLAPFVKTLPLAAHPGTQIFILGTNLTGATSVAFNGTSAAFTVVSPTEITATVPAGSTAGKVEVVTPAGTLSSNVPFRVY